MTFCDDLYERDWSYNKKTGEEQHCTILKHDVQCMCWFTKNFALRVRALPHGEGMAVVLFEA